MLAEQKEVRSSPFQGKYVGVIIGALSALVYIGTVSYKFVYDDLGQIVENPALRSWHFVPQYFSSNVWAGLDTSSYYYRPLNLLWFRLNYALFDLNPVGWHATSLALHALATTLLFRLVDRILDDRAVAILAALVFGLHPIHVQSVAWVSGSADPLVAIFLITGFLGYLNFRNTGKIGWLAASLLAYGAATLTKEPGIVLPAIIFVHECLQPSKHALFRNTYDRVKGAAIAALPYVAVTIVYLGARIHALQTLAPAPSRIGFLEMLLTWPTLLWLYTQHLFLPWGYSLFYDVTPAQHVLSRSFLLPTGLLLVTLVAISTISHVLKLRPITIWTAATWFVIPLLPALYLPAVDAELYGQDRYLYLSVAGFAILLGAMIRQALPHGLESGTYLRYSIYQVALVTIILASCSVIQQQYWKDNLALFRRAVSVAPHNNQALNNLAVSLAERNDFEAALPIFDRAIHQNPNGSRLNYNYGYMLYRMRQYPGALRYFSRTIEIDPSMADAYLYMGMSHLKLGYADDAGLEIAHAIALQPHRKGSHLALAAVLETQGNVPGAIKETRTELSNYPGDQAVGQRLNVLLQSESGSLQRTP